MTNHITKLIEDSGKKLTEISSATNIPYPTLSGYNQVIRIPKKANAQKLAAYFYVSISVCQLSCNESPALRTLNLRIKH